MDKFNILLHQISRDLHPNDLESLIYICKIEESRKANITSGHHLFTLLRHDCRISEDNVAYLKEILKTINRRDLVHLVQTFEGLETSDSDENDILEPTSSKEMNPISKPNQRDNRVVKSIESSSALYGDSCVVKILPRQESTHNEGTNLIPCCTVNWFCLKMTCYKIHFCYVILIVLFLLAIIVVSLSWYANVPKVSEHLNAERSVYDSGKFVIIALIVTFPIFLLIVFFARKYWKKRRDTTVTSAPVQGVAMMTRNEDPVQPVVGQINPNCERETTIETNDEQRTSGSNVENNLTTGDTDPILSS